MNKSHFKTSFVLLFKWNFWTSVIRFKALIQSSKNINIVQYNIINFKTWKVTPTLTLKIKVYKAHITFLMISITQIMKNKNNYLVFIPMNTVSYWILLREYSYAAKTKW